MVRCLCELVGGGVLQWECCYGGVRGKYAEVGRARAGIGVRRCADVGVGDGWERAVCSWKII